VLVYIMSTGYVPKIGSPKIISVPITNYV